MIETSRRSLLRGLFAAPAIVAADRLMPLRGLIMPWGDRVELLASDGSLLAWKAANAALTTMIDHAATIMRLDVCDPVRFDTGKAMSIAKTVLVLDWRDARMRATINGTPMHVRAGDTVTVVPTPVYPDKTMLLFDVVKRGVS